MRELLYGKHPSAFTKLHIFTVIILNDLRMNVLSAKIRSCIHMSDKAQLRTVLIARCRRNRSIHIAVCVYKCILHTQLLQLLYQLTGQVKLAHRRRDLLLSILAGRIYLYIV